jgi:DNA-binding transcriptional ArsR family regulator
MRTLHHPSREDIRLSSVFYALSDPLRLHIVKQLEHRFEISCGEFMVEEKAKSTLSHHFKVLRECGVVRTRIEGTQRFISLRKDDLDSRFPGLLEAVFAASKAD